MEFINDKAGRSEAMKVINELASNGYLRKDIQGQKVIMSKIIKAGKFCKKSIIKEFIFLKDKGKIVLQEGIKAEGVEQAKNQLFGFTVPIQEANNAVRAGLFAQEDYDIMMEVYAETSWWNGG